jgi:hypothetical protein
MASTSTKTADARKPPSKKASGKKTPGDKGTSRALRRLDEEFVEWRYEPAASGGAYVGAVVMSLGGLALGAGVYAQFLIAQGSWHDNARWLLAAGAALVLMYILLDGKKPGALRVGDLGVGFEEDGKTARTAWWEISRVLLRDRALRLEAKPRPIVVPLDLHGNAAARIAGEASARIPKRVELEDDDIAGLGKPSGGEKVTAEPPQVTDGRCRASDEPLTFEKDVRMCGRCGVLYHRSGAPRRCVECGKKLKTTG